MKAEIKKATKEDIDGILEVFDKLSLANKNKKSQEELSQEGFLVYSLSREELEEMIENEKIYLLVSKINDKVMGYVLAYDLDEWKTRNPDWEDKVQFNSEYQINNKKKLYLRHVGRLPDYKGVGSKLEDELENITRKEGFETIIAEIAESPSNTISQKFHLKRGYRKIGTKNKSHDGILWGVYEKYLQNKKEKS